MNAVHLRVDEMLACAGVRVEGWFHCPHKPSDGCSCRKPAAGLAVEAQRKLGFDAADIAFVIGDKKSDVELADALGAPSVLLMTGYGAAEYERGVRGALNCANMCEAAAVIARREREAARESFALDLEGHIAAVIGMHALADGIAEAAAMITSALRGGGRFFFRATLRRSPPSATITASTESSRASSRRTDARGTFCSRYRRAETARTCWRPCVARKSSASRRLR